MTKILRTLVLRLRKALAKAPWELARQDPYPRLQTCCQLERRKDAWRARL